MADSENKYPAVVELIIRETAKAPCEGHGPASSWCGKDPHCLDSNSRSAFCQYAQGVHERRRHTGKLAKALMKPSRPRALTCRCKAAPCAEELGRGWPGFHHASSHSTLEVSSSDEPYRPEVDSQPFAVGRNGTRTWYATWETMLPPGSSTYRMGSNVVLATAESLVMCGANATRHDPGARRSKPCTDPGRGVGLSCRSSSRSLSSATVRSTSLLRSGGGAGERRIPRS
mmetsp:Transcript_27658/g.59546  ORF Transcript_27658/g.59546 Transcript_27658/m.59546 type:complete len:229 (+) Transcript_27658:594-1280(+)